MQYESTRLIVEALESLHREGVQSATLPQPFERACELYLPLAVEVFITRSRREDVLTPEGDLISSSLSDPSVYRSGSSFQYKVQLYHVGLITTGL